MATSSRSTMTTPSPKTFWTKPASTAEAIAAEQRASNLFAVMDEDKSGTVSKDEFTAVLSPFFLPQVAAALFEECDLNGDGSITVLEYQSQSSRTCGQTPLSLAELVDRLIGGLSYRIAGLAKKCLPTALLTDSRRRCGATRISSPTPR